MQLMTSGNNIETSLPTVIAAMTCANAKNGGERRAVVTADGMWAAHLLDSSHNGALLLAVQLILPL